MTASVRRVSHAVTAALVHLVWFLILIERLPSSRFGRCVLGGFYAWSGLGLVVGALSAARLRCGDCG